MVIVSVTFPVGNSLPVMEPTLSEKSSSTVEPRAGTPSMWRLPSTTARPSFTSTLALMIEPVLTWWMRTVVYGSTAFTRPLSMAKGPTPAEILPQLDL